jgi:hypothetical protein
MEGTWFGKVGRGKLVSTKCGKKMKVGHKQGKGVLQKGLGQSGKIIGIQWEKSE